MMIFVSSEYYNTGTVNSGWDEQAFQNFNGITEVPTFNEVRWGWTVDDDENILSRHQPPG
ncbi:MAG: hypothetical protein ACFKPT_19395 [Gloeotrichia echinulata GP01]